MLRSQTSVYNDRDGGDELSMACILIVDDDPYLRELIRVTLSQAGFETLQASNGLRAMDVLAQHKVDLVVMDLMMPQLDGWELCRRIREDGPVPIVMVTARVEVHDKVQGLRLGADDYITKPFELDEMVARIQSVLRRFRIATDQEITIGSVHLDAQTRQVTWNGSEVPIRPKEFLLLYMLASHVGRTVLREQLIEEIWGLEFDGDERTLDVHIKRLRDKFPSDSSPFAIATMRGLGYRLEPHS